GAFPIHAIKACLDFAKARATDLDYVCFGWPAPGAEFRHSIKSFLNGRFPVSLPYANVVTTHFLRMWHHQGGMRKFTQYFGPTKARPRFVDHHLAHAISAYSFSGFRDATVVVIDGRGAWEATSIWYGHDGRLDHVQTISWPNSLGLFYAEFT